MDFGQTLREQLNKKMEEEVAYLVVDDSITDVKLFIPTGCTELDYKCSNRRGGGIPVGKITSIEGLEATGKSLLAMQIMANAQKMGGLAIYLDSEQALNTDFAERVGLDVHNNFVHIIPSTVEDVFNAIDVISNSLYKEEQEAKKEKRDPKYKFAVVIWDSVASTTTKLDLEAKNPDPGASIGVKARTLSKNIPMILSTAWKNNISFVFINQLRRVIGAMPAQDPWEAPGGKAISYYSSLRIRLISMGKLKRKEGNMVVGVKTKAKILKCRFGPPFREASFPIYFTHGIDDEESMIEALEEAGAIKSASGGRNGKQYWFEDQNKETDATKKSEFKQKLFMDKTFREKAESLMEKKFVQDMQDPRKMELELDAEDNEGVSD